MQFIHKHKTVKDIRHFQLEQRVEALEALLEKERRISKKLSESINRLISVIIDKSERNI